MTILETLKSHYVGKTITGGQYLEDYIGSKILDVQLDVYEPIFEFKLEFPNGKNDVIFVLIDWNIEVE